MDLQPLFGVDPRRVFDMETVNQILHQQSPIPVPRVLRKATLDGRPYVVVEQISGSALDFFASLPCEALAHLGEALARIHQCQFDWCGAPSGVVKHGLDQFHTQMVKTMRELAARFYPGDDQIREQLEPMCEAALDLPAPAAGALPMWWAPRRWTCSPWSMYWIPGRPKPSRRDTAGSHRSQIWRESGRSTGTSIG